MRDVFLISKADGETYFQYASPSAFETMLDTLPKFQPALSILALSDKMIIQSFSLSRKHL